MDKSKYSYNSGIIPDFTIEDYVVFALTLVVSCCIGSFFAIRDRYKHTTSNFLLGGQDMNAVPVAFSLTVTFMSAMTLLGNPAEVYLYDTMWWWLILGMAIAMWMVTAIFIPFFYNFGKDSVFEYLHLRFSLPVRIIGCILLILQLLIYGAFLLYAPSLALNAVTGLHLWGSVIGMGAVVTFYTTLGGMKAVIWTDTFQTLVILIGLLAVVIKGSIVEGGFEKAWEVAEERGRVNFLEFSPDPKVRHSVWSVVVGGWGFWLYLYGVNQAQVQRCLSCPSVKKAQLALWLSLPGLIIIVSLCCMIGIVMFSFYKDCHPLGYGTIAKSDQLVPLYVMDILSDYPGLPGVFVSCVISGSLSSLSSGLNALSAVTLRDILEQSCLKENMTEFRTTVLSKVLVFIYGVLAVALAYVCSHLGSVLEAVYTLFGILNGPILGVFTLGMFFPWSNKHGALIGMLTSLAFLLWVGIGSFVNGLKTPTSEFRYDGCNFTAKPENVDLLTSTTPVVEQSSDDPLIELYKLSYMYFTALGMAIVWAVGLPISFMSGYTRPNSLDPRLIAPVVDCLMPCLPERIKMIFRFGIIHEGKYDADFVLTSPGAHDPDMLTEASALKSSSKRSGFVNEGYVIETETIITRL